MSCRSKNKGRTKKMKGIRKLFLGLFLVALFSVGLKVETQAAVTATKGTPEATAGVDYSQDTAGAVVSGTLTFRCSAAADLPANDNDYVTYRVRMQSTDSDAEDSTAVGTPIFVCFEKISGTVYYGTSTTGPDAAKTAAEGTGHTQVQLDTDYPFQALASRSDVRAKNTETAPLVLKLFVKKMAGDGAPVIDTTTSSAGLTITRRIDSMLVSNTAPGTAITISGITVTPATAYLLPGQSKTFTLNVTAQKYTQKLHRWIMEDETMLESTGESTELPTIYKSVKLKPNAAAGDPKVKAAYVEIGNGITVTWPTGSVKPGDNMNQPFEFTANGYTTDNIINGEIYVDSVSASNKLTYSLNGVNTAKTAGNIQFVVPSLSNNTHKLLIKMTDGNVLETSTFTVSDTSSLAWKSTSALTSGVAVTAGMDVYIRQFLSDGQLKKGVVSLESPARDYASMINDSQRVIGSYQVHGDKAMTGDSGKKDRVRISPDTGDGLTGTVTVYPKISIATNSSSSDDSLNSGSSSTTSKDTPIKITSPTYVYYNDKNYQVKKLKLRFAGPKDTVEKTLDAPSTDSTSSLSWSASVDSIKLSKILKEVCDSSSNTITLTVFPYNGDSVDDQIHTSTEIKAYKINLDGGGGAKYTVNGEDMGDYFYAVKGTRYTIKAQPKLTGDKFLNWDGSVFSSESGGEFTASESRTFRANYSSSSSSSSSNTNKTALNGDSMSGDYDDVPKTGESRTDIWILWSVLFISILGAGFMIWKRFGLARAIAEADAAVEHAEYEEQVKAAEKEKKDKLDMLKDLRNL